MCPFCRTRKIKRKGSFPRKTGRRKKIARYFCNRCRKTFSDQTGSITFKQRKSHMNKRIQRLSAFGNSQRVVAKFFHINKITVARKLACEALAARGRNSRLKSNSSAIVFDEMETFEHSKLKPLAIALAVEEGSRRILSAKVSRMPAKGHLARMSLKKYGYRKDCRREGLEQMLGEVKRKSKSVAILKSDECPRYPSVVKKFFPDANHLTYKGRRGCVVGQGELKRGGFDPLFSLNHTCAMLRDNIKRLSRKTWCTTKVPDRLQDMVDIYVDRHNSEIRRKALKRGTDK